MYAEYFDRDQCTEMANHLISRITGLEQFLQDNAHEGASFAIVPLDDGIDNHPALEIVYTDATGAEERFTAAICAKSKGHGLYDAGLAFPDLDAGFAFSSSFEHYYQDESWSFLVNEAADLHGMLMQEVADRREARRPRQDFDIELKATPVDEWTLRVSPADRLWTPKPARPGLGERIRKSAQTAWSNRPRFA